MSNTEIVNAVIDSVSIDTGDRNLLTIWIHLNYGGTSQGFGGYSLYLPKSYTHYTEKGDFAGHFIFRVMEVCGVENWNKVVGKSVRVKRGDKYGSTVEAIGHIVKEDWFNPSEDFKKMKGK